VKAKYVHPGTLVPLFVVAATVVAIAASVR
jgi:hypothetical protein